MAKTTTTKKKAPAKKTAAPDAVTQGQHETGLRRIRDLETRVERLEEAVTSSLGRSLDPEAEAQPEPLPAHSDDQDPED